MKKFGLGTQVLVAILLGIAAGLFFGPYCETIKPIGEVFFMLLQMVVLPYIPFLLIHGLGSLNAEIGKKLFSKGWHFLICMWLFTYAIVYLLIGLIPSPTTAFIENSRGDQEGFLSSVIHYIVPQNFFYDLSHNIVPAVAIFGLIMGAAVMTLPQKEPLLMGLARANAAIEKILHWLARVSPIAVFAHVATAAGTIRFENLLKVEFYVIIFIIGTLFITFWILPVLISHLTELSYRQVLREFKWVCWVPFATALPSMAFPFLYDAIKRFAKRYELESFSFQNTSQTIMPLAFSFAQLGNFFILVFIFFLSFYTRHPIGDTEQWILPWLALPMSFGTVYSSISAVSFLIEQMQFPLNAFGIFEQTMTLTVNFQVLVSVASVFTLILLVLSSYYGLLRIRWKGLLIKVSLGFVCFIALSFSVKHYIKVHDNFSDLYLTLKMPPALAQDLKVEVQRQAAVAPPATSEKPLSSILQRGVLKVGYDTIDIPFAYQNSEGEVVGYDIAFAYQLARDLDCKLELVPLQLDRMGEELQEGKYDIAMAAIVMNEKRLKEMDFVQPYLEANYVLVVPFKESKAFLKLDELQERKNLKIAAFGAYRTYVEKHFPHATLVPVDQADDLIASGADGLLWTYFSAFVWCLGHPEYTLMDYDFLLGKQYISYPIRPHAEDWLNFVQNWLTLKRQSGFMQQQYNYWIKGEPIAQEEPRWSVIRNVLHWVED